MPEDPDTTFLLVGVDHLPFQRLRRLLGMRTEIYTPLATAGEADFRKTQMAQQMFDELRIIEDDDRGSV